MKSQTTNPMVCFIAAIVIAAQIASPPAHASSEHISRHDGFRVHASREPRFHLYVLPTPKGWDYLNLQGITDSGVVYGTVQRGGGMNDKYTAPFNLAKNQLEIAPNNPNAKSDGPGGLTTTVRYVSNSGKVLMMEREKTWDGAWMGSYTETWVHTPTFTGILPGPTEGQAYDITNCWMTKDDTVYGTCANNVGNHQDFDLVKYLVCIWQSGKLIRSIPGKLLGVDTAGKAYIEATDGHTQVLANNIAAPVNLPQDECPDSITPSGWLVKAPSSQEHTPCLYKATNRNKTLRTVFAPEDITNDAVVVGSIQDGSAFKVPLQGMIQTHRKSYDLSRCVVNMPPNHRLTDAYAINSRHWILARTVEQGVDYFDNAPCVLLKPVRD